MTVIIITYKGSVQSPFPYHILLKQMKWGLIFSYLEYPHINDEVQKSSNIYHLSEFKEEEIFHFLFFLLDFTVNKEWQGIKKRKTKLITKRFLKINYVKCNGAITKKMSNTLTLTCKLKKKSVKKEKEVHLSRLNLLASVGFFLLLFL